MNLTNLSSLLGFYVNCWINFFSMASVQLKRIILKNNVDQGIPTQEDFSLEVDNINLENVKAEMQEGDILVGLKAISADPYLRLGIKTGSGSGLGSISPGELMKGMVVAEVLASNRNEWKVGELFGAELAFASYQVLSSEDISSRNTWNLTGLINESSISQGVGVLGMPGATAYGGLIDILKAKKGETIFISAASGAVGGFVGMIAKNVFGCTVIGSCGGPEKCDLIKSRFGYDYAIDYKAMRTKGDYIQEFMIAAPNGIDMYFENVGGIQFEAVMDVLRPGGRVALCGWISEYNKADSAPITMHPAKMIFNQQRIEGFLCFPWLFGERGNFLSDMHRWLQEGKLHVEETVLEGMENWPIAFESLFTGKKRGKVVVKV